ncbi:MAG: ATP-binding protein [Caldimonas sp.]
MIARRWRKLGLMSRLAISCGAVLAVLSTVLVVNFVHREVDRASADYPIRLDIKLSMLVTALTGPAILGDYTGVAELLRESVHESDVRRIEWAAARGKPITVDSAPVVRAAPAWFEAFVGFPEYSGSRRMVVGGTDYGAVSLHLDTRPKVNQIWNQVAGGALTVLIGVGAMLCVMLLTVKQGLGSLTRLVSGVRRFEDGDFSARVAPVGPPEIVSSIVAFNRMAEQVGAVFVSLRDSEAKNRRLATIVEQSNESILTRDLDGRITSWNKGAERLFGWSAAEAIGRSALDLDSEASVPVATDRSLARLPSAATWTSEGLRLTKSGARIHVSVTRAPLLDQNGHVVGEIRIARDVTELKKAQALLIGAKEELEARVLERTAQLALARDESDAANRAKSAFLATMSHEIRTPMNGVVGMIDVLEQSNLKRSQAEIVGTIRESAYALLGIVDDVLDFSKIEAGQFEVDIEPMAVGAVVEGVCHTLGDLAGKKGVELTLFTDPAIPLQVLGDTTRLRQVLFNLAGNAVKFSSDQERRGRVSVRVELVERGADKVLLEFKVTDNGIGMDARTLSRLFTPFTQADTSTTRRYGGTGLGLSISHRLVALMGGALDVKSEQGRGSVFTLRLPVAPVAPQPDEDVLPFDLTGVPCLVEGEPEGLANDVAVYLEHAGASVHRAEDRSAARQWFRDCAAGTVVGVAAGPAEALDATLAEWREACASRTELTVRFVAIDRGWRAGPRIAARDRLDLQSQGLRRSVLLKAVALAAGRMAEAPPEQPAGDTSPAPLATAPASARGRTILVAEDNEVNQTVLRQQLALLGFGAHIVGTGREALECTRRGDYPLLLTDLHMPQMDGYELTLAIREDEAGQRRIPIVALTANALKGEADRCRALGMDAYMTKPVQLTDLAAMLRRWLPAGTPAALPLKPAPAAAHKRPPALDITDLESLVGDDPEVIAELLHRFRISAGQATLEMRVACMAREATTVAALAHKLKSSARTMGAVALGELCEQLETAGNAGELGTIAGLWPMFQSEIAAVDESLGASLESC